jgi:hypothetical protein
VVRSQPSMWHVFSFPCAASEFRANAQIWPDETTDRTNNDHLNQHSRTWNNWNIRNDLHHHHTTLNMTRNDRNLHKTRALRAHTHHRSPNNLEPWEIDGEGFVIQCLHEGSDANAAIVRLSKENQSKSSPGGSTLHVYTIETWKNGKMMEK